LPDCSGYKAPPFSALAGGERRRFAVLALLLCFLFAEPRFVGAHSSR